MDAADPARKVGLMVAEWGTWYDATPGTNSAFLQQENTLRDALVAATNFHIFHRHAARVHMANIAQMVNVLQAMILTDGPHMALTPTYHAFALYRPFQGATALPVRCRRPNSPPATAACRRSTSPPPGTRPARSMSAWSTSTQRKARKSCSTSPASPAGAWQATCSPQKGWIRATGPALPPRSPPCASTGRAGRRGKLLVRMPAKAVVRLTLN